MKSVLKGGSSDIVFCGSYVDAWDECLTFQFDEFRLSLMSSLCEYCCGKTLSQTPSIRAVFSYAGGIYIVWIYPVGEGVCE
jgi:hypothetical protein